MFSGRYKALLVKGGSAGYLRTVCDYVHLNPARARLLGREERLPSYPWSSLMWYLAAPKYRPRWMRMGRLLDEHGIGADTEEGRRAFEAGRGEEANDAQWEPVRRGWCLGGETFRKEMVERMEGGLKEHHSGELRRKSAEVRAERIGRIGDRRRLPIAGPAAA